ncbi:unnamed protein product, partial [Prorocentrum cordatum]
RARFSSLRWARGSGLSMTNLDRGSPTSGSSWDAPPTQCSTSRCSPPRSTCTSRRATPPTPKCAPGGRSGLRGSPLAGASIPRASGGATSRAHQPWPSWHSPASSGRRSPWSPMEGLGPLAAASPRARPPPWAPRAPRRPPLAPPPRLPPPRRPTLAAHSRAWPPWSLGLPLTGQLLLSLLRIRPRTAHRGRTRGASARCRRRSIFEASGISSSRTGPSQGPPPTTGRRRT